jgi:uncharacterized damage-inducible protein DinB
MSVLSDKLFLDYTCRRFERELEKIQAALGQIDEEDMWLQPAKGANSIATIMLHLCGNVRQWMGAVAGLPDVRNRPAEFTSTEPLPKAELLSRLEIAVALAISTIQELDPHRLTEALEVQGFEETVLSAIYGCQHHFSEHTGQITYIAKLRCGLRFKPLWVPENPAQGAPDSPR